MGGLADLAGLTYYPRNLEPLHLCVARDSSGTLVSFRLYSYCACDVLSQWLREAPVSRVRTHSRRRSKRETLCTAALLLSLPVPVPRPGRTGPVKLAHVKKVPSRTLCLGWEQLHTGSRRQCLFWLWPKVHF